MHIKDALALWLENKPVAVQGKTFDPVTIEEVKFKTGDRMYWIRNNEDLCLSVDPESEEITLFHDLDEEIEIGDDLAVYSGQDFECSYVGECRIMDGEEELDKIVVRDYEGPDGQLLRAIEYIVSGEKTLLLGHIIPEEELTSV
mgnify:FL=1|jgi:hypothetical protein